MNSNRFESFKLEEKENLSSRMIWTGLYNNERRADLNVLKFLKEFSPFKNVSLNNVNDLYKVVKKISKEYCDWCIKKDCALEEAELEALSYHFIGCIGEFFFHKLFEKTPILIINHKKYRFDYVCPRLKGEKDYGVDLTGCVSVDNNLYDCVFQVKFWNPYAKDYKMTYDCLSGVYTDAILNDFIEKKNDRNVFVCWLNNDNQVTKALQKSLLWNKLVFIGKKELDLNINRDVPEFWRMFINDLNNIC